MRWKRWIWILALLAVVGVLIYRGLQPKPVLVEAGEVKPERLEITIDEEGKTRVSDRFVISTPVAGFVHRINLKVGDMVREGSVVAMVEPALSSFVDERNRSTTEAQIAAADAAVRTAEDRARAAQAEAEYAESQLERVKKLASTGDVAKELLDRAMSQSRQAEAGLSAARHAVEQARGAAEALRRSVRETAAAARKADGAQVAVKAPLSGRVLKLVRESEGVVNAGEPLIEVANPLGLEVEVELLSPDAVRVAPGTRVRFERWGGEAPLEGRVRRVEPTGFTKISALGVEEQRVKVIADFTSPRQQWERLGDGYRVEARFVVWEGEGVLTVPASALFPDGDGWAVFAIEGGVAKTRKVKVGRRNGLLAQIVEGLARGERVVLHPGTQIKEGTMVTEERPSEN